MADQKITVEQLAADEYFQQWVLAPTPKSTQYWKTWAGDHPGHQNTLEEARNLIVMLEVRNGPAPQGLQEHVWKQVKTHTEREHHSRKHAFGLGVRYGVAAALFILLAGISFLYLAPYFSMVTYRTAYGKTRTILLPDSSVVTLNANSSLHFSADWEGIESREIWLEGEAFFEVRQIPLTHDSSSARLPFIVHSHNMDVEVLGTTFNVKDRQSYSEVVLNSGKVTVTPRQAQQAAPIALQPGDWLAYSMSRKAWKIQHIDPEIPTSWRNKELVFDEMRLEDMALLLKETYGYNITIEQDEIKDYRFTGNIKTDEIEMLMPMLERSFGLEIKRDGNKIHFSKK